MHEGDDDKNDDEEEGAAEEEEEDDDDDGNDEKKKILGHWQRSFWGFSQDLRDLNLEVFSSLLIQFILVAASADIKMY